MNFLEKMKVYFQEPVIDISHREHSTDELIDWITESSRKEKRAFLRGQDFRVKREPASQKEKNWLRKTSEKERIAFYKGVELEDEELSLKELSQWLESATPEERDKYFKEQSEEIEAMSQNLEKILRKSKI